MIINYLPFRDNVASIRLRAKIPLAEMKKLGHTQGNGGVFVAMKHNFSWDMIPMHKKLVFDVCDNHFNNHLSEHYRFGCKIADVITCNSEVMKEIIKKETGRDAFVIPEPYESEEGKPSVGENLLWFGHASNLVDIKRLMPSLKYPLKVLTNYEGYDQWTPETFKEEMGKDNIVVIPTGKSMAKSENRMVESIRNGKIVCSEFLPAYKPFYEFMPSGPIADQIEHVLAHPEESLQKIAIAQEYIRDIYSPSTIAKQWLNVFEGI